MKPFPIQVSIHLWTEVTIGTVYEHGPGNVYVSAITVITITPTDRSAAQIV